MVASRRQRILEAFKTRVEAIKVSGGFDTNAGELVLIGEHPVLGPGDKDSALSVIAEEDQPIAQTGLGPGTGATVEMALTVGIHALTLVEQKARSRSVVPVRVMSLNPLESMIADIKKAVELTDRTMGGLVGGLQRGPTTPLEREEGSTTVGASVRYVVIYAEAWGDPEKLDA